MQMSVSVYSRATSCVVFINIYCVQWVINANFLVPSGGSCTRTLELAPIKETPFILKAPFSHTWHISSWSNTEYILFLLDCSVKCNDSIQANWPFFQDFDREFVWYIRVSSVFESFQFEFPAAGMRQIPSSEQCPDKHTYSLLMYMRKGPMNLGTFCENGTITRIQFLWRGRLSLKVPKDTTLGSFSFRYSKATGKEQKSTHSLTLSNHFILVRVAVDPKLIPRTLCVRWEWIPF